MNSNLPKKPRLSLIERAAQVYDFDAAVRKGAPLQPLPPVPSNAVPAIDVDTRSVGAIANGPAAAPAPAMVQGPKWADWTGPRHPIDHAKLHADGFIDPDAAATGLSEEFRIVKRKLLTHALGSTEGDARRRAILINSAHPGDGKSWVTINLALSLSAESDLEVLLVDADFAKPTICSQLGLPEGRGFMDALADPSVRVDDLVLHTDIPSLCVLPAGRQVVNDTEILASERTAAVIEALIAGNSRRIILFDSPPALAASAASELARHVGMVLLVVRADRTSDVALRDAVQLLSACPMVQAVLNGVKFSSSGRLFGTYYGKRN